jgi:hypothetical protein
LLRKPSSCCFSDKSVGISAKRMRTAHIIILRLVMCHHVVVCVCVCVSLRCLGRCVSSGQERKSRKIPKTGINKGAHKLTQRVEKDSSLVTCQYIDSARQDTLLSSQVLPNNPSVNWHPKGARRPPHLLRCHLNWI